MDFSHYSHLGDGRVGVYFNDWTTEEGELLVVAGGSRSKVREQYLLYIQRELVQRENLSRERTWELRLLRVDMSSTDSG